MPYQHITSTGADSWFKISGFLTVKDYVSIQELLKKTLERFGHIQVLIEDDGFRGWSDDPSGWESTSFLIGKEEKQSKFAFVGDGKWRDDIYLFIGKPLREVTLEYFPPEKLDDAKKWIFEEN